jgi:crotonobetainyl-CoA:carnitine CoA-transferase CaiB-like acyl-CoA transferase
MRQARPAAQFTGSPFELRYVAPAVGEHTSEILKGLGIGSEEVEQLRTGGVIKLA